MHKWIHSTIKTNFSFEIKLEALNKSNKNFIEEGAKFLNICTRINELYVLADVNQKQKLINYVLQNLTLESEELHYEYKKPFDFFVKGLNHIEDLGLVDGTRTFYEENKEEFKLLLPMLKDLII